MPPHRPRSTHVARRVAMCSVLCALSTVILGIGTLLDIIDLTSATLAAIVPLLINLSYGPRYALLSYAVTSTLGLLFMPQSFAVWSYIGLMGYYPVLKRVFDRLPRVLGWLIKTLLFSVVMGLCLVAFHFLVMGGEGTLADSFLRLFDEESGKAVMAWAILGLSFFTFVLFDILLDRLLILYRLRWKRRIDRWMKP